MVTKFYLQKADWLARWLEKLWNTRSPLFIDLGISTIIWMLYPKYLVDNVEEVTPCLLPHLHASLMVFPRQLQLDNNTVRQLLGAKEIKKKPMDAYARVQIIEYSYM